MSEPGAVGQNGAEKNSAEKNVPGFDHAEDSLAASTGIAKRTLAASRIKGLVKGVDWSYVGQAVAYSKAGMAKLMTALGMRDAVDLEELAADTTPVDKAKQEAPIEGTVRRLFTNRHLVEVELEDKTRVRVRVRDSKNFKPGMAVPIRLEAGLEMWTLTRKEPRYYGKW